MARRYPYLGSAIRKDDITMTIMDKMISLSNESKMPSPTDIVFNGVIRKTAAIREKTFKCACCGKVFKPNDTVGYFYTKQGVEFVCPVCQRTNEDEWTVVELLELTGAAGPLDNWGGNAKVRMKSGRVTDVPYRMPVNGNGIGEIPKIFYSSFAPIKERYSKELEAKKCNDVSIKDDFKAQIFTASFGSGKVVKINFKVGTNNKILYSSKDLEKLASEEIYEINLALKEKGLNQYYIIRGNA